ncbi:MAG: hypothetical protein AAF804_22115 [Bacteroidota bacterium]
MQEFPFDRLQRFFLIPPMVALTGFALYLLRSYWLTGSWLIERAETAYALNFGWREDLILGACLLSILSFIPWILLQVYLFSTRKQNFKLFLSTLLGYALVGFFIMYDALHLVPSYWD